MSYTKGRWMAFGCRLHLSPEDQRAIAEKRRQARALHDCALAIGTIPGRERDSNSVSKEAAIADAEVAQMLASMTANALAQGPGGSSPGPAGAMG